MRLKNSNRIRTFFALAVLGACSLAGATARAQQDPLHASYRISIATTEGLADDPHDDLAVLEGTWRAPSDVLLSRRNPVVKLENTSPDDFNLLNFTLDINDPNFVFDAMMILDSPTGVGPIITSPADTVQANATSSTLQFDFSNRPLAPGESITFIVELEPAAGAPNIQADYRKIFWNQDGNLRDDNSLLTASFDKGPFPEFVMGETMDIPTIPFYEFPFADRQFDTDKEDGATGRSQVISAMGMKSGDLGHYEMNPSAVLVPEPTSFVTMLAGLLLLGIHGPFRRKRSGR